MSFNYFSKETTNTRYYPAELGIVRFSIKKGLTKKYHSLINPGPLPLGHAYTVLEHSNKTHKLPVPPRAIGETEYELILNQMIEFFIEDSTVKENFPVFVRENEMEMSETIIRAFCDKSEVDYDTIRILPVEFLFHKLRVAIDKVFVEKESEFSMAIAYAYLEQDSYQYYAGNGCKYHEKDDVNIHCALSRSTRWAYYIIDQSIGITGGKKKPGFHFPKGCKADGQSDEDSNEEEDDNKPSVKNEEVDTDLDYQYTEASDLKVRKHEFNDDETTTVASRFNGFPHRPKQEYRGRKHEECSESDETESTMSNNRRDYSAERSYTRSVGLSTSQRSTNPFHKDNFPALGAVPKKVSVHSSYRRFGSASDSDDSSGRRSAHKGNVKYCFID